ncbi:MAG TPA: hypothetical protein VIR58_12605 [Acidimicrobiales bacterium]
MPSAEPIDTLAGIAAPAGDASTRVVRRRRILYSVVTAALAAIIAVALVGGLTDLDTVGVDSRRERAVADGYELVVHYGTVTRGGLATPFEIEVTRTGGFDGPITIGVSRAYLELWDENGFYPTPSAETTNGDWLMWEFDPPDTETFRFSFDARIAPSIQRGASGSVAVFDANVPVVSVDADTRVLP